jgi:hypothetical protein
MTESKNNPNIDKSEDPVYGVDISDFQEPKEPVDLWDDKLTLHELQHIIAIMLEVIPNQIGIQKMQFFRGTNSKAIYVALDNRPGSVPTKLT